MKKINTLKMKAGISIAGLVLGGSAGAMYGQQNLLANGSFESGGAKEGAFYQWGWIGPATDYSDFGVAQSSVAPAVAEQGSFYAYFHGHPTDGSQDCLGQSLSLTVGSQYTITYYLGTDGTTLGSGAAMWVVIGTSFGIDYSQDALLTTYTPNATNALPYQKFTTTITATNADVILSFHGIDATSSILLDNVSVALVVPKLDLSISAKKLVFNWTSSTNGFLVQTNTSLRTANWVTLTNKPVTVGTNNQIILAAPTNNVFYRLMLP
jgi:hypothetical protein